MPSTRTLTTNLLPLAHGLRLEDVSIGPGQIVAILVTMSPRGTCPVCGTWSEAVHSLYERTIADLPWGQQTVQLRLRVRKFFCRQPTCSRRIFTERLPAVVAPYARRSRRLTEVVRLLAFALGGELGARIVERLGMATSPATLLRLIRRTAVVAARTPRVLGGDDWAMRKRHTYGTILVDLEQHRLVDLLPDRTAATLAAWLQDRPGVEIVSRDRSGTYAEGVARGAPDAVQVADRFHLTKNLGEAVVQVLERHRADLREVIVPSEASPQPAGGRPPTADLTRETPTLGVSRQTWSQRRQQARRSQRVARYERMLALRERGLPIAAIAQELGVARRTIHRWLAVGSFSERTPRRRPPSPLAPFAEYLTSRWAEGCHNGMQLWREVCEQGYAGPRYRIWEVVQRLRAGLSAFAESGSESRQTPAPRSRPLSPRQVVGIVLRRPTDRTVVEQQVLGQVIERCPDARVAYDLSERFLSLLRERQAASLAAWLTDATQSGLPEFQHLASGLLTDQAAVAAAAALSYSNGQTEGQVNKLKVLKRQMYGRAKFDLLKLRLLNIA
ncbi:MAG: ISL3 family transposase [Chloroflexi bacterium]|nr:ISL3 family transposase [Chloroflexota bacterium]